MVLGSALGGYLGDRFGRRTALAANVTVFGAATVAVALIDSLAMLALLRFLAGAGIGGALPNASTLTAEFAPFRRRALVVTLTIVCVPLGGLLAGVVASRVLPVWGWRPLFVIGGLAPLGLAILLGAALPESPRFLARRPERWPELARLFTRLGHRVAPVTAFTDVAEQKRESRDGFGALFGREHRRDTAGLWLTCFSSLIAVFLAFSWLPAMLTSQGMDLAEASRGLAAYNFGGVAGPLVLALVIARLGSRIALLGAAAGGGLSALVLAASAAPLVPMLAVHGFFVNALQTTLYALGAHVYPTRIRATGTASALAFGRVGAILTSYIGPVVIAAGRGAYFDVLALGMAGAFVGLAIVRHHIPGGKPKP
jgi:AAHS family 4-hydroxybenzoate transporter-like MFS transporter